MRKAVAVSLLTFACSCAALAQVAGLGGITGSVRDATGSAVPGASVTVANDALGIKRTMETTDAGVFAAPALNPSRGYSLVVKKSGFSDYSVKEFEILVGQTLDFKVNLSVSGAATTVDVTAEAPLVEDTKTGVSAVVEKDQIDNLPINGRRVDSFVLLTPAVTNDGEFGLVAFRGMAGHNSFLTDGNDTTQSFYNENAGRTRISTQISQDAVQEFQVLSNGFSAEFGKAMGGVINTVTRSGTNDIHGTAFWFFRNRTLNATDRYANGLNAPEWRHQAGGTVGGPIKKDKLFFFLNGEFVRRNFPGQNRIVNNAAFTNAQGELITSLCPGTAANAPTQAQCDAAFAFIRRQLNVLVPRTVRSDMGFAKIDWRPLDRHSFSFSGNLMHWDSPHGIQTQAVLTTGNMLGNNANSTVETRYGRASWTSIPTNNSVNEFRFGWFKDRLSDPAAADLFPRETGALSITLNNATIGAGDNYPRTQPNEVRYQFADNFSWTVGAHSAKFGVDIATTNDYVDRLQRRAGSYAYQTLANFARDFSGNTLGAKSYQTFQQGFGTPTMNLRTTDYSFYAQDTWKLSRRLTFNYGLRYEYASLPQPTITNPDYPQTSRVPSPTKNFGPRVNLSYSLSDRTVIRGGYGIFYGRFHGALMQTLFFNNARYQSNFTVFPTDAAAPVFPNTLPSAAGSAGLVSIAFADKDFRSQYSQQGTIAIEHQVMRDVAVTASYMWTRGIGLYTLRDLNLGPLGSPITYQIQDVAGAQTGTFTTGTYRLANRVDPRYRSIYQVENGGQSWYNGLSLQVRKRFSHGFTGAVAYTWSHAIDTANLGGANDSLFLDFVRSTYNGDWSADKGTSLLDQRHRAVINFLWRPKFTNSTSAFAKYFVNGWELSQITTLATPKPAPATVTVGSAVTAGGALANTGTLNGSFGSNRVPFWPFNPLQIDNIHRVDARLQRDLPFSERVKAKMSFEAFNAFNTISNTFVQTQAFNTPSAGVLRQVATLGNGTASQGFPDGTNARRMQVGLRLEF